jgi:gamma-glutamyl-gamma-aminobutyrate hydrolase PuuD
MPKVYIVGGDNLIERMFLKHGWEIVPTTGMPDLVQFTGGSDVDPSLYGQGRHPATRSDPGRDAYESSVFHSYLAQGTPMSGICRGGQFLNVMSGGSLWQHVDRHAIHGVHTAYDVVNGDELMVTSTHHQMMIPAEEGAFVLLVAKESQVKQSDSHTETLSGLDTEAVFYEKTNCLCYQPHPEYVDIQDECQRKYFEYLETFFNLK